MLVVRVQFERVQLEDSLIVQIEGFGVGGCSFTCAVWRVQFVQFGGQAQQKSCQILVEK